MNIRQRLRESLASKDIIITIPKTIPWEEYQRELDAVADNTAVMNYKVKNFPNTQVGNRCYVVYNGQVIGWMGIVGMSEKEFTCTTTGKQFKGKFIERSGKFHKITPIPMKGFQGFRYFTP